MRRDASWMHRDTRQWHEGTSINNSCQWLARNTAKRCDSISQAAGLGIWAIGTCPGPHQALWEKHHSAGGKNLNHHINGALLRSQQHLQIPKLISGKHSVETVQLVRFRRRRKRQARQSMGIWRESKLRSYRRQIISRLKLRLHLTLSNSLKLDLQDN